jgi:hypothetical protein
MGGEHPIRQQLAEPGLWPPMHNAMKDAVQICSWVHVVGDTRRNGGQDDGRALGAFVEPGEEPVPSTEGKSRFILPASRFARGSTTRGIPGFSLSWTSSTASRAEARTSTFAFGPTGQGSWSPPGCLTPRAARRCCSLNEGIRAWPRCAKRVRSSKS